MHFDADDGTVELAWSPASNNVAKHFLYLSTDSLTTTQTDILSPCLLAIKEAHDTTHWLSNVHNLDTYYWRVDEEAKDGNVTQGEVWCFRPRHLAFPGAEGYGRFANGGRGGQVVYVTNLNDDGEGSFRQAATNGDGPRTILFDVSGIITLESRLVGDKNVTIAGQTAPGKGVCFKKAPIGLNHDNICRFVRLRLGEGETADGLPDWWENLLGTNPNSVQGDFTESNSDPDGDGFTQLEDYLNWMADTHYVMGADDSQTVSLPSLFAGYTASPEYKAEVVSGTVNVAVAGGQLSINAGSSGLSVIEVVVTDGEGSSMTRRVNVAVTPDTQTSIRQECDEQPSPVYTIGGMRVGQPLKGIHIKKNKKYIVK